MARNIALLALVLSVLFASAAFADEVTMTTTPSTIEIGTAYDGMTLHVAGTVPEGCQAVVRFLGKSQEVHMKEKGKAFGLLWMNMNSLSFTEVPSVFLLAASSADLGDAAATLGFKGLRGRIGVHGVKEDPAVLVDELVRLKQKEGLYRQNAGTVEVKQGAVSADIVLPSRLTPGAYTVEITAVKDGAIVASATQSIEASLVGAPSFLAQMAFNRGALYGVMATLVAILSGLAIGIVFQSKGGAH